MSREDELQADIRNLKIQLANKRSARRLAALERLRKAAYQRFNDRRSYEWKVSFGLWTALGAAAGFIIKSDWKPSCFDASVGSLFPIGIAYVYIFKWIPGLFERNHLDSRTTYYWESAIRFSLGPEYELPKNLKWKDWVEFTSSQKPKEPEELKKPLWERNYAYWLHCSVTAILALLFCFAVWTKHNESRRAGFCVSLNDRTGAKL